MFANGQRGADNLPMCDEDGEMVPSGDVEKLLVERRSLILQVNWGKHQQSSAGFLFTSVLIVAKLYYMTLYTLLPPFIYLEMITCVAKIASAHETPLLYQLYAN